jgi:hypothetical protein
MKNKQNTYNIPQTELYKGAIICVNLLSAVLALFVGFLVYLGITYYNLAYPSDSFCKTNYDSGIEIKEARGCEDYYLSRGY